MNMERFKDRERKDEDLAEEIDSHLAHEKTPTPRADSRRRKPAVGPN